MTLTNTLTSTALSTPALVRGSVTVVRDPAAMLQNTLRQWGGQDNLWVFAYASLIWRQEFTHTERHVARVHGWHRALIMWSRINRGTPECPGLVFALLAGGSCQGVVFKIVRADVPDALAALWYREMPTGVYDAQWLRCTTPAGTVKALAFTLPRNSPNFTGALSAQQYQQIFKDAVGRYGTTRDYAQMTYDSLRQEGIHDRALEALLRHASP